MSREPDSSTQIHRHSALLLSGSCLISPTERGGGLTLGLVTTPMRETSARLERNRVVIVATRCWHCGAGYVRYADCCLICSRPRERPRPPSADEADVRTRATGGRTNPTPVDTGRICRDCSAPTYSAALRCAPCRTVHEQALARGYSRASKARHRAGER